MLAKLEKNPRQNFLIKSKNFKIRLFLPNAAPASEIYKTSKILKLSDYILLQNALLKKNFFEK